jgi:hypothetical protein
LEYDSDIDAFFENEQDSLFAFDTFDKPNIERDALFIELASYVDQGDRLKIIQPIINNNGESSNLDDNILDLALNIKYSF